MVLLGIPVVDTAAGGMRLMVDNRTGDWHRYHIDRHTSDGCQMRKRYCHNNISAAVVGSNMGEEEEGSKEEVVDNTDHRSTTYCDNKLEAAVVADNKEGGNTDRKPFSSY
jgi:hypothetical protein